MSDDSEPGEIKSPDISTVVRHKRTAEEKRNYKSEKKLRLDKDHKTLREDYREYKEYKKEDYRHEDRASYDKDRRDYEERSRDYERDRVERDHVERDRVERDHVERDRVERDRVERDRVERDHVERDRVERDRVERDRTERDRLERDYIDRDRIERDRVDRKDVDYYKKDEIGGKRSGYKDDYKALPYKKEDLKEEKRKADVYKEKFKTKEDKLRSDEERAGKLSREEELLDEIRSISEEISKTKSKREGKSPSSSVERREKKEKVKDPEKKKKKEAKKNKEKHAVSTQEKYEKILKDKLKEPSSQSPEEVSIRGAVAAPEPPTVFSKKKSVLEDSSSSSTNEVSDEEMAEPDLSPAPLRPTPSPSPPPDPLAGLPPYYPALQGCRNVDHFEYLNRIEEGTYGVVFRARDKRTNEHVALKKLKMEKEKQGFPITSLREINTLLKGQHENVVHVREIVVGSNMDKIYIVMDYVEHDLKALMENMKEPFLIGEVKTIMRQLMCGLAFLHDNWIIHRDIKTSNLLFSHGGILKIGDFGLAREYGSPLKQYTEIVVTLWYRAPELLLGCKMYSVPIDVWSAGCVFGELLGQKALFPGKSEIDQLNKIFKELGTPTEKIWPGYSDLPATQRVSFVNHPYNKIGNRFPQTILSQEGFSLLNKLLCYDPAKRITAAEAEEHKWFSEGPLPVDPSMFPTWPAKSEMNANPKNKVRSPKPPSGGGAADKLENSGFKFLTTMQGSSSKGPGFILK